MRFAAIIVVSLGLFATAAHAERVKDLASVQGVRNNQLIGYGLVVGLDGTGDQTSQTPFTLQSIKNMLIRYGVTIPPGTNPQLKNVAAVTVHADLPPFAKPGQNIDVTVSSIGNAGSLRGGSLIMTPLLGADGQVYAMAPMNQRIGGVHRSVGFVNRVHNGQSSLEQLWRESPVEGQLQRRQFHEGVEVPAEGHVVLDVAEARDRYRGRAPQGERGHVA